MAAARNLLLEAPSRPVLARVAMIGAGTLGPDLACYLKSTLRRLERVLIDAAQTTLDRALARFEVYPGGGR